MFPVSLSTLIAYVAVILLAISWVWYDASKRNSMPWFWTLISAVFFPVGLIAYLIFRTIERTRDKV